MFYGTVESGKAEAVYTSACILSNKYDVNYVVIKPDVFLKSEKIMKFKENSCVYENAFTLSSFFKKKRVWDGTLIVHVQHFHLFTIDELEFLFKFFKFKDALIAFWGLKRDYTGKIYDQFIYLLQRVDYFEELKTTCSLCEKREAEYNQGLVDGEPMAFPIEDVYLLSAEFVPVCEHCFIPPMEAQDLDDMEMV